MLKSGSELRLRDLYLNRLIAFQDTEPVKIITGIRRCGKSSLMKLMILHLRDTGVADDQIIEMNFESMDFRRMTVEELYRYVKERLPEKKRAYLFFDEIQRIDQWQDAVNSFRVDFDCDIYVTGSNAYLLSSEYATYLAGRSVEIKMLPLSFREFLDFHGYTVRESKSPAGGIRKRIYDADGESYEPQELLDAYLRFGGMPGIADVGLDTDKALTLLDGIYSTVVVRDILERERRRGQRQITDPDLLRKIIMFLTDNIGNSTSITSISNTLVNEKLLDQNRKGRPSVHTIQAYVGALLESYIFYEIKRFDIKVKGAGSDIVDKFFATSQSAVLFPEYIARSVRQGMEEANLLPHITAAVTRFDGMDYRSIASVPDDDQRALRWVEEGAAIPQTQVKTQENLVKLHKRGRMLVASYEAIRYQKLDLFSVTLRQIGAHINRMHLEDAIEVLLNGDGNDNPAEAFTVGTDPIGGTAGTLTYDELVDFWGQFEPYEMNTLLVSGDMMRQMLKLEEFQNPLTGLNFQGTGRLDTPLGAALLRTSALGGGTLIGLDRRYALEMVQGSDVLVEYDKLIDRQLEREAITSISGFAKPYQEASKVLSLQ